MLVIAIILALMAPAFALEQHDHNSLGLAGDFYAGWKRPDARFPNGDRSMSCCNKIDCYQPLIRGVSGHWEYMSRATGRWKNIPEVLLESNQADPRESPDGLPHVCENSTGYLLCAVLGGGI
jgi:hypothetical protein